MEYEAPSSQSGIEVQKIAAKYSLSVFEAQVLYSRCPDIYSSPKFFLENSPEYLNDPFLFRDMEKFCKAFWEALENGEKFWVFGDRDTDGITSTVLIVENLLSLGAKVGWSVPKGDEPYGFTNEKIKKAYDEGYSFLISVDCGITLNESIDYAISLGMKFAVIDHHLQGDKLNEKAFVINPKVEGETYPEKNLSAAGVLSKVLYAINFYKLPIYNKTKHYLFTKYGKSYKTVIFEFLEVKNFSVVNKHYFDIPILESGNKNNSADLNKILEKFVGNGESLYVYDRREVLSHLKSFYPDDYISKINLKELKGNIAKTLGLKPQSIENLKVQLNYHNYSEDDNFRECYFLVVLSKKCAINTNDSIGKNWQKGLDLVAISTIADMMSLLGENHLLVRLGLNEIKKGNRKVLSLLIAKLGLPQGYITEKDIAWWIAPVLNSMGRMGIADKAVEILLSGDINESYKGVELLLKTNTDRQEKGSEAWNLVSDSAKKSLDKNNGKLIYVASSDMPRGFTGVSAGKFMNTYGAPCIIVSVSEDVCIGSMRAKGINVKNFLSKFDDLFLDYGGHTAAGGFMLSTDDLDEFNFRLSEYIKDLEFQIKIDEIPKVDLVFDYGMAILPTLKRLNNIFSPFGEGNEPLKYIVKNAQVLDCFCMGKQNTISGSKHLKMQLRTGREVIEGIFWNIGDNKLSQVSKNGKINILANFESSYWRGNLGFRFCVLDLEAVV